MDNSQEYSSNTAQQVLSLCTGYGGIEQGMELAGVNHRTVAFVEIEAFAVANLVAKMEQGLVDAAPVWTNLKTFDAQPFCGKVHGITGGYPCQPFSNAGKRKGEDDPRHLWPHIRRIVPSIRPVWCFFENVEGHLNLGYDEVYRNLRDLGYRVEAGLFSAEEVGAPHARKRLFILAVANDFCKYGGLSEYTQWGEIFKASAGSEEPAKRFLSNTLIAGSQGATFEKQPFTKKKNGPPKGSEFSGVFTKKWPARPGQPQYEWESPRAIPKEAEPDMGLTVNGYQFRTDLLRALGNGVVPQTAAKAWITLWQQQLENL